MSSDAGRQRFRYRTRWQIALRYSGMSVAARSVGWALSTWMKADGSGARPSVNDLAKAADVSERTVQRSLSELRGKPSPEAIRRHPELVNRRVWIRAVAHDKGGRGLATEYQAIIPPDVDVRVENVLKGARSDTLSGSKGRQETSERVTGDAENPDTGDTPAYVVGTSAVERAEQYVAQLRRTVERCHRDGIYAGGTERELEQAEERLETERRAEQELKALREASSDPKKVTAGAAG